MSAKSSPRNPRAPYLKSVASRGVELARIIDELSTFFRGISCRKHLWIHRNLHPAPSATD